MLPALFTEGVSTLAACVHCLARAIWDAKVVKERERVKKKLYLFTFLAWAKDYDENVRIL